LQEFTQLPAGTICLFTRPVVPGRTKTRLAHGVGADAAASLAEAFLIDSYNLVTTIHAGRVIVCLAESGPLPELTPRPQTWLQGGGDLGERMAHAAIHALTSDPSWVIIVGSDSPGLPSSHLRRAVHLLQSGADSVLGPAEDGGYYLLGLRRCPPALLSRLDWGTAHAARDTLGRLRDQGFDPQLLPTWFDIDTCEDLGRLQQLLDEGLAVAPETLHALIRLVAPS